MYHSLSHLSSVLLSSLTFWRPLLLNSPLHSSNPQGLFWPGQSRQELLKCVCDAQCMFAHICAWITLCTCVRLFCVVLRTGYLLSKKTALQVAEAAVRTTPKVPARLHSPVRAKSKKHSFETIMLVFIHLNTLKIHMKQFHNDKGCSLCWPLTSQYCHLVVHCHVSISNHK